MPKRTLEESATELVGHLRNIDNALASEGDFMAHRTILNDLGRIADALERIVLALEDIASRIAPADER